MKGVGVGVRSEGSEYFSLLQILGQQNNGKIWNQQGLKMVQKYQKK